jgi:hypothetical protein
MLFIAFAPLYQASRLGLATRCSLVCWYIQWYTERAAVGCALKHASICALVLRINAVAACSRLLSLPHSAECEPRCQLASTHTALRSTNINSASRLALSEQFSMPSTPTNTPSYAYT